MLAPCTACRRHVRVPSGPCPFCGGAVGEATYTPRGRGPRAAILFASVVGIAGCGSDDSDTVPIYGAPPYDDTGVIDTGARPDTAVVDTAATDTATTDAVTTDTSDASDTAVSDAPDAPGDTRDSGGAVPPYGAPFHGPGEK